MWVIIYSPSCRSKPIRLSFIFGTQIRYFRWNLRAFWPCIDSNATDTFKAQKGSKDVIKIVSGSTLMLWSYKNKLWYSHECTSKLTWKRRNGWIKSLFLFSLWKKYSYSFIKLRLNHWCHMDYFNNVLTTFLGLERVSSVAIYESCQKALGFHQKYLNLHSKDEGRSYGFGMTWGWVNNDGIFIFGWKSTLKYFKNACKIPDYNLHCSVIWYCIWSKYTKLQLNNKCSITNTFKYMTYKF